MFHEKKLLLQEAEAGGDRSAASGKRRVWLHVAPVPVRLRFPPSTLSRNLPPRKHRAIPQKKVSILIHRRSPLRPTSIGDEQEGRPTHFTPLPANPARHIEEAYRRGIERKLERHVPFPLHDYRVREEPKRAQQRAA